MKFPLRDKVLLITGASGGLGEALAVECAARGARLALASRNQRALKAVASRLRARAYPLDVGKPASVRSAVKRIEKDFGRVDVLVNNAGIHLISKIETLPEVEFEKALNINVFGPIRMLKALLPGMRSRRSGMIVQISSTLAYRSLEKIGAYAATKAALARLTESLRMELMGTGIHVLDVAPGVVKTRLRSNAYSKGEKPVPSANLPFAAEASDVAKIIADAMESMKRDIMPAAWPVRLVVKYLNVLAAGYLDRKLHGKN